MPHGGTGTWRHAARRGARVLVDDAGELRVADGRTRERIVTRRGDVGRVWWVDGPACADVGLPTNGTGWLVVTDTSRVPVLALQIADWLSTPTEATSADADDLRAAGFEALADGLGRRLEAVSDGAGARRSMQHVTSLEIARPQPLRSLLPTGVLVFLFVAVPLATVIVAGAVAATPLRIALLIAGLLFGRVVMAARAAITARGVRRYVTADTWVPAPAHEGGIGRSRSGDLVVSDGGYEQWLPGPRSGGAAALVVVLDETGAASSIRLYDRDDHVLALLPTEDWLPGGVDSVPALRSAVQPLELSVSMATLTGERYRPARELSSPERRYLDALTRIGALLVAVAGLLQIPQAPAAYVVAAVAVGVLGIAGMFRPVRPL